MRTEALRKRFEGTADRAPAGAILRVTDRTTGEFLDVGQRMDATSPLLLASVSKMLTSACVLAAVDRGALTLRTSTSTSWGTSWSGPWPAVR